MAYLAHMIYLVGRELGLSGLRRVVLPFYMVL